MEVAVELVGELDAEVVEDFPLYVGHFFMIWLALLKSFVFLQSESILTSYPLLTGKATVRVLFRLVPTPTICFRHGYIST